MMKIFIAILCFLFVGCCPFFSGDCFYTIEKDENVEPIEKYRDTEYYLSFSSYDFENDSLQEKFYNAFRLYIDSVNVYNLEMPVSVDAFITAEGTTQKIDSSLVEYRTVIRGMLGIFIYRKFTEPSSRLKIVIKKEDKEHIFEFDITQKAYKSRHSKKWLRFISF